MTRCIVVCPPCHREAIDGKRICSLHDWYFRVFLADPIYRDHPVPELMPDGSLQAVMFGEDFSDES